MIRRRLGLGPLFLLLFLGVWGLWAPLAAAAEVRLPVLMYHDFGATPARYRVTLRAFRDQLDWLQGNGYTAVTIRDVHAHVFNGGPLPEQPVVLTFDDGRKGQWSAVAELNQRGMPGVFFVLGEGIGLSDAQLVQMIQWGHDVEAHSMTHPFLTQVSDARLAREVEGCKRALESRLGAPVRHFAYPYGDYDGRVIAAVIAAGYDGAVAAWGDGNYTPARRWRQPRVEISGHLSLAGFAGLVRAHSRSRGKVAACSPGRRWTPPAPLVAPSSCSAGEATSSSFARTAAI